jgi:hypothetical protein
MLTGFWAAADDEAPGAWLAGATLALGLGLAAVLHALNMAATVSPATAMRANERRGVRIIPFSPLLVCR